MMHGTPEQQHEERIKKTMSWCVHFNGIQNKTCRANINYREIIGGDDFGWARRMPCDLEDSANCTITCASRKFPLREEAEDEVIKTDKACADSLRAVVEAHADAKKKGFKRGHGGNSSMACPVCGGKLHYRVSGYNGHMHAKCETDGCVSWME